MYIIIPNLGLRRRKDPDLDDYATDIVALVPLVFADTTPKITDVKNALDDFHVARLKVKNGTPSLTKDKNVKRGILSTMLTELAYDCSRQAGEDEVKFLGCGIAIKRKGTPKGELTEAQNLRLSSTTEGTIDAEVNAVAGGTTYLWFISDDNTNPESFKLAGSSSGPKFTYKNLTSGRRYYAYVYATGSRNKKGPPSITVSRICA